MRKPKRAIFRIEPTHLGGRARRSWSVRVSGAERGFEKVLHSQEAALGYALERARTIHHNGGLAQVVLHGRSGRIRWERTFGADPRRRKG